MLVAFYWLQSLRGRIPVGQWTQQDRVFRKCTLGGLTHPEWLSQSLPRRFWEPHVH